jgi:hypothetical protein
MTMTLEEAIAEVTIFAPWDQSEFELDTIGFKPSIRAAIACVLQAVASGDLIPASDARLAVALAYQRAGEFVAAHAAVSRGSISPLSEQSDPPLTKTGAATVAATNARLEVAAGRFDLIAAAILALANSDDLAKLNALRADLAKMTAAWDGLAEQYAKVLGHANTQEDRAEAAEAEAARLKEALTAAVEYMEFHSTAQCEPYPLDKCRAALATPENVPE